MKIFEIEPILRNIFKLEKVNEEKKKVKEVFERRKDYTKTDELQRKR